MRLLIDTNVFLEVLLQQAQADAAAELLQNTSAHEFWLTDFALHSICVALWRNKAIPLLYQFLNDVVLLGNAAVVTIAPTGHIEVVDAAQLFKLDFDDAYQYVAAEKNNLILVSFDKDFDRTPSGRQTPQAINRLTTPNPNPAPKQS
jgi:uncharacterized protein